MNSRALRRLAADHGALHSQPLPPNFLFPPGLGDADDLSQLDILLAGPTHTPFAAGVWKLHLTIPPEYPQQPPKAHFRTSIFHPNVDPQSGGVCVETLKRDWDTKLTLRDVLVTISCLLIQPNPDSALNAEAGALIQEDYDAFARRAELMTSINAIVPKALQAAVKEAQERGQGKTKIEGEPSASDLMSDPNAPVRRRRPAGRIRGTIASRRSDGSPSGAAVRRRPQAAPAQPFVMQTGDDDVFGATSTQHEPPPVSQDEDSSMLDANQENDEVKSPMKDTPTRARTPRRPQGVPVPLGELTMDDVPTDSDEKDDELEYPPSPKKSPSKTVAKRKRQDLSNESRPESSRDAITRAPNITPPNNSDIEPLAQNSPFAGTPSPHKLNMRPQTPASGRAPLFPSLTSPQKYGGIFKARSPSSAEKKAEEIARKAELNAKLWELCGRDIERWNVGDFDGEPFKTKAKRW